MRKVRQLPKTTQREFVHDLKATGTSANRDTVGKTCTVMDRNLRLQGVLVEEGMGMYMPSVCHLTST